MVYNVIQVSLFPLLLLMPLAAATAADADACCFIAASLGLEKKSEGKKQTFLFAKREK